MRLQYFYFSFFSLLENQRGGISLDAHVLPSHGMNHDAAVTGDPKLVGRRAEFDPDCLSTHAWYCILVSLYLGSEEERRYVCMYRPIRG